MSALPQIAKPFLVEIKAERLAEGWLELRDADPANAYRAALAFSTDTRRAAQFLSEHLRQKNPNTDRFVRLIRDLDAESFEVREKAQAEIEASLNLAVAALLRARNTALSPEVRRRIALLLDKWPGMNVDFHEMRALRGVELIERLGGTDGTAALEVLSQIQGWSLLEQETREALERVKKRVITP